MTFPRLTTFAIGAALMGVTPSAAQAKTMTKAQVADAMIGKTLRLRRFGFPIRMLYRRNGTVRVSAPLGGSHPLPRPGVRAQHFADIVLGCAVRVKLCDKATLLVVDDRDDTGINASLLKRTIVDPGDRVLAQIGFEHLTNRGLGQFGQDCHVLGLSRALMNMDLTELHQRLFGHRSSLHQFYECAGHFTPFFVGNANHSNISDLWMPKDRVFDLSGIHILAA